METTAVDLVRYRRHAGYFDNVATVLAEIPEHLDVARLAAARRTTICRPRNVWANYGR